MASTEDVNTRLRRLPKVDDVLKSDVARRLLAEAPRWAVVTAIREEIQALRDAFLAAPDGAPAVLLPVWRDERLSLRVTALLKPPLVRVINATGVVLHTNLGRAPLAKVALARIQEVASGYCNLEYRLETGERGSRHDHAAALLCSLTGAEAALVVNNCAAAVLLGLSALAAGREVIVSRGELVEIGGSFRVPDVMASSGATLIEVGTTNRTHLYDYQRAITSATALLLKVHRSNFAIVGFTAEVGVAELAALAERMELPVMVDLGAGTLCATSDFGLGYEPTVQETIAAGADVVTFSGDKLLGGPQAGVLLLRKRLFERIRTHPLVRALRPDKLSLAALTATLELYRDGRLAEVPALAMLRTPLDVLEQRAEALRVKLAEVAPGCVVLSRVPLQSAVGGGALPLAEPPSWGVAVEHPRLGAQQLEARLRCAATPVITRMIDGRVTLDVRTLDDDELALVAAAVADALKGEVSA